jgi:hypothetical protein
MFLQNHKYTLNQMFTEVNNATFLEQYLWLIGTIFLFSDVCMLSLLQTCSCSHLWLRTDTDTQLI